jgi:hypothetical protein
MALTGQNFDNFWPDGRGKKSRTQWLQSSILRSFRMRAINWSCSTVCFRARRRATHRTSGGRFVELFPASALVQTPQ